MPESQIGQSVQRLGPKPLANALAIKIDHFTPFKRNRLGSGFKTNSVNRNMPLLTIHNNSM